MPCSNCFQLYGAGEEVISWCFQKASRCAGFLMVASTEKPITTTVCYLSIYSRIYQRTTKRAHSIAENMICSQLDKTLLILLENWFSITENTKTHIFPIEFVWHLSNLFLEDNRLFIQIFTLAIQNGNYQQYFFRL